MVDIGFGDFNKKILRMGTTLMMKKMGASIDVMQSDLECCPNKLFRELYSLVKVTASQIKTGHHQRMVIRYGTLGVWILYKDTAYKDAVIWMIWKILKNADKLLKIIEPHVKQPEEWYPNLVHKGREKTKQKIKEGKIPANGKDMAESVFVPSVQQKLLNQK